MVEGAVPLRSVADSSRIKHPECDYPDLLSVAMQLQATDVQAI